MPVTLGRPAGTVSRAVAVKLSPSSTSDGAVRLHDASACSAYFLGSYGGLATSPIFWLVRRLPYVAAHRSGFLVVGRHRQRDPVVP